VSARNRFRESTRIRVCQYRDVVFVSVLFYLLLDKLVDVFDVVYSFLRLFGYKHLTPSYSSVWRITKVVVFGGDVKKRIIGL